MINRILTLLAIIEFAAALSDPYLGCFKDTDDPSTLSTYTGKSMTSDQCKLKAQIAGAAYYALSLNSDIRSNVLGGYCRYGNSVASIKENSSGCLTTAGGMVGRPSEIALYLVNPYEISKNFVGCFKDDPADRAVSESVGRVTTEVECKAIAQKARASFYVLQNWQASGINNASLAPGGECRYGNYYHDNLGRSIGCVMTAGGVSGAEMENAVYYLPWQPDPNSSASPEPTSIPASAPRQSQPRSV